MSIEATFIPDDKPREVSQYPPVPPGRTFSWTDEGSSGRRIIAECHPRNIGAAIFSVPETDVDNGALTPHVVLNTEVLEAIIYPGFPFETEYTYTDAEYPEGRAGKLVLQHVFYIDNQRFIQSYN